MARPERFELPTARFVAEYSIQLSAAPPSVKKVKMAEREGFEPSMELLTPYSLSRGAPSASRPSLPTHNGAEAYLLGILA
jgi:hypothetical protein